MMVFLTGDRSMPDEVALMAGASTILQIAIESVVTGNPVQLSTGDNKGFEQGVRAIAGALGVELEVVPTGVDPDTHKPAWDTRHELVNLMADKVVFLHNDPLSSSIGASLLKQVDGDKVQMATL